MAEDTSLLAYLDRWSAEAGTGVRVHASGPPGPVAIDLVDLVTMRDVDGTAATASLCPRRLPAGSFVDVAGIALPAHGTLSIWVRPAGPDGHTGERVGGRRTVAHATAGGWRLVLDLDPEGAIGLAVNGTSVRLPGPVTVDAWTLVVAAWEVTGAGTRLTLSHTGPTGTRSNTTVGPVDTRPQGSGALRIGAGPDGTRGYRGRIALPALSHDPPGATDVGALCRATTGTAVVDCLAGAAEAVWDFAADPGGRTVLDVSGNGNHATAVNRPLSGLRGPGPAAGGGNRTAACLDPDDLDDAGWPVTHTLRVPAGMDSTVLGVRLRAGGQSLTLPLVVGPRRVRTGDRRIAVLLPTFTYLAYANHRQASEAAYFTDYSRVTHRDVRLSTVDRYVNAHPELGPSLYDRRGDGSAAYYSSRRRPVLNHGDGRYWWMTGAPRHFAADILLLRWLAAQGDDVDVLTDDDVHADGVAALAGYRVLVTGSHPEYVTTALYDAVTDFVDGGGRLVYLGGNGFYWVTGVDPRYPYAIEVRRGDRGGWWDNAPGEEVLTSTGEQGGLWRDRGRPPQALLGVGFAAQGWGPASGYRRLPDSFRDDAAWVFDGVSEDPVGCYGPALGGAAGDEIDRAAPELGTSADTLILATSAGTHGPHYQPAPEDAGPGRETVRADLTLRYTGAGGAVFAVGSINWICSLTAPGGDNGVARITRNVITRFAAEASLERRSDT